LSQVGEFSFVLAATARTDGVLAADTVDLIISVIIVLMLATPFMISRADELSERLLTIISQKRYPPGKSISSEETDSARRVLVVGLGPAGRQVVDVFTAKHLEPVLIDLNPSSREYAHQLGLKVHLGDASQEEVLLHSGLGGVCMAVVTIPDPKTAVRIVEMIRRLRPNLAIAVRCRYNRHMSDLKEAGADVVVDEEATVGNHLGQQIMAHLIVSSGSQIACRFGGHSPETIAG